MNNYFLCVLILFCFIVAFFSILSSITQFESYAQVESLISYFYSDSFLFVPVDSATDGNEGFDMLDGAFDVTTFTIRDSTFALVTATDDNGIQVIDISDPTNIIPVDSVTNTQRGFFTLAGPRGVTSVIIDGKNYALVTATSRVPGGIQVINMTDPANLTPADSVTDGKRGFDELDGAYDVATVKIKDDTFALVTAIFDDGIQVINMTDPAKITPSDSITFGKDNFVLERPSGIATVTIDGDRFALVTSSLMGKIQVVDISDPTNIIPGYSVTDGNEGFDTLNGASGVTTFTKGDLTFALVASSSDHGIQVINMTDPANLMPVDSATDGNEGFDMLQGAFDITTVEIGSDIFALVASTNDDGIQVINMTDPAKITPVYSVTDGNEGFDMLDGVRGITTITIGGSTFALAVSGTDAGIQVIDISKRVHFIDLSDSLSILDSANTSVSKEITLSDSIAITDSVETSVNRVVNLSDSLSISDFIETSVNRVVKLSDGINITDSADVVKTEFVPEPKMYDVELSDGIRISDSVETSVNRVVNLSDSLAISDSVKITMIKPQPKSYSLELSDSLVISDFLKSNINRYITLSDSINRYITLSDSIKISDSVKTKFISSPKMYNMKLDDGLSIADSVKSRVDRERTLSDGIIILIL